VDFGISQMKVFHFFCDLLCHIVEIGMKISNNNICFEFIHLCLNISQEKFLQNPNLESIINATVVSARLEQFIAHVSTYHQAFFLDRCIETISQNARKVPLNNCKIPFWEWILYQNNWQPYKRSISDQFEEYFRKNTAKFHLEYQPGMHFFSKGGYNIDLEKLDQSSCVTNYSRKIRREERFHPKLFHWFGSLHIMLFVLENIESGQSNLLQQQQALLQVQSQLTQNQQMEAQILVMIQEQIQLLTQQIQQQRQFVQFLGQGKEKLKSLYKK